MSWSFVFFPSWYYNIKQLFITKSFKNLNFFLLLLFSWFWISVFKLSNSLCFPKIFKFPLFYLSGNYFHHFLFFHVQWEPYILYNSKNTQVVCMKETYHYWIWQYYMSFVTFVTFEKLCSDKVGSISRYDLNFR